MKTFEEALVKVIIGGKNMAKEVAAAQVVISETAHRYRELIDDAHHNDVVKLFCMARCNSIAQGKEDPIDVMMSMFCCGLVVGVEMEKQDPGVEL